MPRYTTKYALPFPIPSDTPRPPRDIQALAEKADQVTFDLLPLGCIMAFTGDAAAVPDEWMVCDGSAHDSLLLREVLGSDYTPDLRNRYLVGTGAGYVRGATGGVSAVTLTAPQAGAGVAHYHSVTVTIAPNPHTHPYGGVAVLTRTENQDHGHVFNPPPTGTYGGGGHAHGVVVYEGYASGDGSRVDTNPTAQPGDKQVGYTNGGGGHEHAVDIPAFWTYTQNASGSSQHTHYVDVQARTTHGPETLPSTTAIVGTSAGVAAPQAHPNDPPYVAFHWIIRRGWDYGSGGSPTRVSAGVVSTVRRALSAPTVPELRTPEGFG